MTAYTLQASLPEMVVVEGMQIRLEAISPTTGLPITGVTATHWAIYGEPLGADIEGVEELPAWVPDGDQGV